MKRIAMKRALIEERVRAKAKNNRIACKQALALAVELGVTPKRVGDAANALKIRVSACQLGCFK